MAMLKKTQQQGVGLIEVMITVLVLATALLTVAALQTRALQFNQSAYVRSQANIFAYDIIDRIRINRGANAANIAFYEVSYDGNPGGGNGLATADINEWRQNLTDALPAAKGAIDCTVATQICTVSIRWVEEHIFGEEGDDNSDAVTEFNYSTRI